MMKSCLGRSPLAAVVPAAEQSDIPAFRNSGIAGYEADAQHFIERALRHPASVRFAEQQRLGAGGCSIAAASGWGRGPSSSGEAPSVRKPAGRVRLKIKLKGAGISATVLTSASSLGRPPPPPAAPSASGAQHAGEPPRLNMPRVSLSSASHLIY